MEQAMSADTKGIDEEEFKTRHPKLSGALLGDGKTLSEQLMISSLYVMAFECLKDFIQEKFDGFFSDGFSSKDGRLVYTKSKSYAPTRAKYLERYKQLAKSLLDIDANHIGTFHAACAWFDDMEAFDD